MSNTTNPNAHKVARTLLFSEPKEIAKFLLKHKPTPMQFLVIMVAMSQQHQELQKELIESDSILSPFANEPKLPIE